MIVRTWSSEGDRPSRSCFPAPSFSIAFAQFCYLALSSYCPSLAFGLYENFLLILLPRVIKSSRPCRLVLFTPHNVVIHILSVKATSWRFRTLRLTVTVIEIIEKRG